ncbi:autotransporter domain-containing protein [Cetobacterium sp.]|uniref:autotransporter outer membrane beta-barrel domain-containing protein n=1 Tax=Cetobacterium sp. TaxID=2071632 RepID=UPI003EE5AF19
MKKKLLLLFSFLFVCNKISFADTKDSGLIFFTNFKYFKSNERNFKSIQGHTPELVTVTPTPDKPTPPSPPNIPTPPDLDPEEPEIIPPKPETPPSKPDSPAYSEIFFDNNWILNTHSYTTSKDLEVSSSSSLLTGMGVIAGGASITNNNNISVKNELESTSLVGMLSLNGGTIINDSNGNISVDGVGKNFGMYINGDGIGNNFGTINAFDSQIGVILDGNGTFTNYGNIEAFGNSIGIVAQNFGQVTNKGTITLSPSTTKINSRNLGTGILVSTDGVADNFGTINVLGDQIGMASKDSGNLFNSGEINLTNQGFGMVAINSSSSSQISNDDKGIIKGNAQAGILVHGLGSAQNYGNIDISNGLAALIINGQGSAYNLGTIDLKNTKYGMLSLNGGTIVNGGVGTPSQIVTDNKELAQMAVLGNGAAFNHGTLSTNTAPYLMYLSGNGNLTNYGTLLLNSSDDFLSYSAMFGKNGGTLTNYQGATISIDGGNVGFAMTLLESGHLLNNGTINAGIFENGILLTGSATGTNNGDINFSLMGTGVALYNTTEDSYFTNFGSIQDTLYENNGGDFGIYAIGSGIIENLGTIKLSYGSAGIYLSGKGEATNFQEGNITIHHTRYGMYATNGGTIINEGTIEIIPIYNTYVYPNGGMFIEGNGTAVNNGNISFGGSNTNGMASLGSNANLINGTHGVINILDGATESFAFNTYNKGGVATNKGLVNLGEVGELINGGTLFNYGNIIAPNGIKNGANGVLVMERGGTTNAELKETVLGLSYAQELYSNDTNFVALSLPFVTESATSYSHLYEVNKNGNEFLMRRKNFTEVTERNLGNFLENIYFDSTNNIKDKFFNILMTSQNNDQYNGYLDSFFGRDIYPNIIFQTKDTIQYTTEDILNNLGEKLSEGRESSYIVGYTFEKFRQKGFDRVEGHEDNLNGFYLGKQYYLDNTKDYGFVFSYTRLDSDYYSNSGKREDNFLQGTSFLNYNKDNLSGIGALYLGYSTGNIKRNLDLNYLDYSDDSPNYSNINEKYKGNIKNLYLGVSGNLSKQYNFNSFFLEPKVEGYVLGVHQKKINESGGEYELGVDSLNSVFSKIKTEIGLGKTFAPTPKYLVTFKITGALAQEINSKNNDLDVSLKKISDKNGVIKVNRDNQFSQEIGTKLIISNSTFNNFNFYIDYKYIFEDDNSWKIGTGINYSF